MLLFETHYDFFIHLHGLQDIFKPLNLISKCSLVFEKCAFQILSNKKLLHFQLNYNRSFFIHFFGQDMWVKSMALIFSTK